MKSTMSHWYDNDGSFLDKAERRGFLWLDIPFNFIHKVFINPVLCLEILLYRFFIWYIFSRKGPKKIVDDAKLSSSAHHQHTGHTTTLTNHKLAIETMLASRRLLTTQASSLSVVARASASSFASSSALQPSSSSRAQHQQFSFSTKAKTSDSSKTVVVVDGVRLPFAMTSTIYEDQMCVDLQRLAYQGLITKTALDKSDVDYVLAGTVIQEVKTSNIAREAAINAGFPASIGAHTVAMVRYEYICFVLYTAYDLCTNILCIYMICMF